MKNKTEEKVQITGYPLMLTYVGIKQLNICYMKMVQVSKWQNLQQGQQYVILVRVQLQLGMRCPGTVVNVKADLQTKKDDDDDVGQVAESGRINTCVLVLPRQQILTLNNHDLIECNTSGQTTIINYDSKVVLHAIFQTFICDC